MAKHLVIHPPEALVDPRYRGKHILMVGNKVVVAGDWKRVSIAFDKVTKQGKTPQLAYIPKADTLILTLK